jgi:hypothetical protein
MKVQMGADGEYKFSLTAFGEHVVHELQQKLN